MNTFAIPYFYLNDGDIYLIKPEVMIIKADSEEMADLIILNTLLEKEKACVRRNDPTIPEDRIMDYTSSIWFESDRENITTHNEEDEEGWVIGKPILVKDEEEEA